jgi:hypothetical protein
VYGYKNKNTGDVFVYSETNPDLDARPNFERVDVDEDSIPETARMAAERAAAEVRSIEGSALINAQRVEVSGVEAARAMGAGAKSAEGVDGPGALAVTPMGSHHRPESVNPGVGVLSRPGVDDVQIGPNPEEHPRTKEELLAQARLDSENPLNAGVLSRNGNRAAPVGGAVADDPQAKTPAKKTAKKASPAADKTGDDE